MLSLQELLKGKDYNALPKEHQANLMTLLERINKVRTAYGKSMTVSSGYRSLQEHLDIYKRKGITDQSRIPMKSKHLFGQAVDISDPNKELQVWCQNNESLLRSIGLWMEDFGATPNWVHFQVVQYGSYKEGGSLWFKP